MHKKNWTVALGIFVTVFIIIWLGILLFEGRKYHIFALIVTSLTCILFFYSFEQKEYTAKMLVFIAIMVTFSVIGRVVFVSLPGFQPIAAISILVALHFGAQAGFLTGALSAFFSNLFLGQGPWTIFQMLAWGITGFLAGVLRRPLMKGQFCQLWLSLYGVFAGIVYSLLMDIWSILSFGEDWSWNRYSAFVLAAIPFTIIYAVSNVIFLMLLAKPLSNRLVRFKNKYGLQDI